MAEQHEGILFVGGMSADRVVEFLYVAHSLAQTLDFNIQVDVVFFNPDCYHVFIIVTIMMKVFSS